MRIQNEQSGSTSLSRSHWPLRRFRKKKRSGTGTESSEQTERNQRADKGEQNAGTYSAKIPRGVLEFRLEAALAALAPATTPSSTIRQGHLALLKRWYYRPEAKRAGEIFFPDSEDHWPVKSILRGVGRKSNSPPPEWREQIHSPARNHHPIRLNKRNTTRFLSVVADSLGRKFVPFMACPA